MDGGTTLFGWKGALLFWDGRGHYSFGMEGGTTLLGCKGNATPLGEWVTLLLLVTGVPKSF